MKWKFRRKRREEEKNTNQTSQVRPKWNETETLSGKNMERRVVIEESHNERVSSVWDPRVFELVTDFIELI